MIFLMLPAYNEGKSLEYLLPKIDKFMQDEFHGRYQILICNDGSSDDTADKIEFYSKKMPIFKIEHEKNRGLGETTRDLFEKAAKISNDEDILIRMDCDDTHEPQYIKGLIEKINEGYDVVTASRFAKGGGQQGINFYRKTISLLANRFMKLFFPVKGLRDYSSAFRAYKASLIKKAILIFGDDFIQIKGLGFTCSLEKVIKLKMLGAKFSESPFLLKYDQKKTPSKMVVSVTTLGYMVMVLLYYWPFGGWRARYKKRYNKGLQRCAD